MADRGERGDTRPDPGASFADQEETTAAEGATDDLARTVEPGVAAVLAQPAGARAPTDSGEMPTAVTDLERTAGDGADDSESTVEGGPGGARPAKPLDPKLVGAVVRGDTYLKDMAKYYTGAPGSEASMESPRALAQKPVAPKRSPPPPPPPSVVSVELKVPDPAELQPPAARRALWISAVLAAIALALLAILAVLRLS